MRISLSVGGSSILVPESPKRFPSNPKVKKYRRTLKFKGTMLRTRMTNNIHFFSSSTRMGKIEHGQRRSGMGVPSYRRMTKRTGTETGPATECTTGPQVAVHNTSPHKFQEEVKRILELIIEPGNFNRIVHRPSQRRVRVRVE